MDFWLKNGIFLSKAVQQIGLMGYKFGSFVFFAGIVDKAL